MSEIKSESPNFQAEGFQHVGIARRHLLRAGLAATPVLLAVSGRSAMAQTACPVGLSEMTLMSVCPEGEFIGTSGAPVASSFVGRSPGYWKPNSQGQTFQPPYRWPVAPFTTIEMTVQKNSKSVDTVKTVSWDPNKFTEYKGIARDAAGWATGMKYNAVFAGSFETRSFSRILLDSNGSLEWHLCAAYLNAAALPGKYVLTTDEVKYLAAHGTSTPGGTPLTTGQIKAFLSQTWA